MMHLPNQLIDDLNFLKEKYLECSNCASEKHCCKNLSSSFGIKLESYTANSMFGIDKVKEMISDGRLLKNGDEGFMLVDKCPLLDSKGMCSIHDQKEKLELNWCMEFPVYASKIDEEVFIVADLKCPSVESYLDKLKKELEELSLKYSIKVAIRSK